MSNHNGWIGVDLDGTLAHYDGWKGTEHIGEPIKAMQLRVLEWCARGVDVRIVTARVSHNGLWDRMIEARQASQYIAEWCVKHLGHELPITCTKDYAMIELWDDRAIRVVVNIGERCCQPEASAHAA